MGQHARQFVGQPQRPVGRQSLAADRREPMPQRFTALGRRPAGPQAHVHGRSVIGRLQHRQRLGLPAAQRHQGIGQPGCRRCQRHLGLRERRLQSGPHRQAQAVAGETRVAIALVVDVAQAMRRDVSLDGLARVVQPGSHPAQAVAQIVFGHRRQARHSTTAQGLQQEGFGLVAAVVGQQEHVRTGLDGHLVQGLVAQRAGLGLHALTRIGRQAHMARHQAHRQALGGPGIAGGLRMGQPGIGVRAQAMVDVQGHDAHAPHTERLTAGMGWRANRHLAVCLARRTRHRVQQGGRVTSAAVGHGHARHGLALRCLGHGWPLSARSCR